MEHVAIDDGGVSGRNEGGVQEIQKVCHGRSKALDLQRIDTTDSRQNFGLGVSADAGVKHVAKGALIDRAFINVRDTQLGFPQKSVIGTFENLTLLGHRMNHGFQRRPAILCAKTATRDLGNHRLQAAPDRAEVLDPLFPQEPGLEGARHVSPPVLDQDRQEIRHWDALEHARLTVGSCGSCRVRDRQHGASDPVAGRAGQ